MKSDSVQFNTRKTLQHIIQVLNSFKCEIQSIQPDPFAQDKADIEVVMIGMATMADAAKQFGAGKAQWGVQVYVYDMGKYRSVELVALGESGFKYAMTTGRGQSALDSMISGRYFINMRHSKAYRDKIMRQLEPVTSGGSRSASDASKSRLYRAIDQQPAAESKELVSRIHSQMQTILSSFLRSHPDFSEPGLMTVPNGELRNHVAELRQITEDDAITGNDRSALYTLIYVLSVIETDKSTESFMALNLLDRVLKLENAGVNISEDMKIWPLFARYFDFTNWHEMKYGENGTSGKLNASDPAIEGAKGSASSAKAESLVGERAANAGTEAAAASGSTASEGTSGRSAGGKHAADGGTGGSFNRKYLILGAAFLAVILLTAVIVNSINKAKYEDQAPAASDTEYSGDVDETTEATVLSSDWDWDSSREAEDGYAVDTILLVRNDSDEPITGIDYYVSTKNGDRIVNEWEPDNPMHAYGYVKGGSVGIMVGEVCTAEHKTVPDDSTYTVTGAYSDNNLENYTVPTGYVTRNYGEDNNDYDVSIDNPNSLEVSRNTRLVMAKIENNKIVDSDATGELTSVIEPNTMGFIQEKAFYDPHMYVKYTEVTVYAIDFDLLGN